MFKRYIMLIPHTGFNGKKIEIEEPDFIKIVVDSFILLLTVVIISQSVYTVQEGSVGIVKRFGEAIHQVNPGLHFKVPFTDKVVEVDIRTRKYKLTLQAATTGINKDTKEVELQVPSTIIISANWSIPKQNAMAIYQEYGSLQQYEDKILDPRVIRTTKATIAKYSIESLIATREIVANNLRDVLLNTLKNFKGKMTEINIEDVRLPQKVRNSIEAKQVAKQTFQTEQYTLDKQNLVARREVNSANASAEALTISAKAQSKAIILVGKAEAEAITVKAQALKANPLVIELTKAESWNGKLPTHMLGDNTSLLLSSK